MLEGTVSQDLCVKQTHRYAPELVLYTLHCPKISAEPQTISKSIKDAAAAS